jgi:hypothetical protein
MCGFIQSIWRFQAEGMYAKQFKFSGKTGGIYRVISMQLCRVKLSLWWHPCRVVSDMRMLLFDGSIGFYRDCGKACFGWQYFTFMGQWIGREQPTPEKDAANKSPSPWLVLYSVEDSVVNGFHLIPTFLYAAFFVYLTANGQRVVFQSPVSKTNR